MNKRRRYKAKTRRRMRQFAAGRLSDVARGGLMRRLGIPLRPRLMFRRDAFALLFLSTRPQMSCRVMG